MANVISLLPNIGQIGQIHGRVGNFVFSVRNGVQRVHLYEKKTSSKPPTPAQLRARTIFAQAVLQTTQLQQAGDNRPRRVILKEVFARIKHDVV